MSSQVNTENDGRKEGVEDRTASCDENLKPHHKKCHDNAHRMFDQDRTIILSPSETTSFKFISNNKQKTYRLCGIGWLENVCYRKCNTKKE
jgi:hypothetical protein